MYDDVIADMGEDLTEIFVRIFVDIGVDEGEARGLVAALADYGIRLKAGTVITRGLLKTLYGMLRDAEELERLRLFAVRLHTCVERGTGGQYDSEIEQIVHDMFWHLFSVLFNCQPVPWPEQSWPYSLPGNRDWEI